MTDGTHGTHGTHGADDSLLRAIAHAPEADLPQYRKQGEVVAGRFSIEQLAGTGGMGTVYRAFDRVTAKPVALKFLRHAEDDAERFAQEARLLADLRHPAIVQYVAHGTTESGQAFLAMEWLDGVDLRDRLAREGLGVSESIALARRVADGLAVAHARGIVHRDVKPSNVLLPGGEPAAAKLLDFGIARLDRAHVSPTARPMTRTGIVLGTVGYMSPEQAAGDRTLDARTDVFALGCLLFECLTGRPAFAGTHVVAVLAKVLREDAPRLRDLRSDLPLALDALISRMLAKARHERPADGAEVSRALEALGTPTGPPPAQGERPAEGLGGGERRLMSLLLADVGDDLAAAGALVDHFGGELTPLANGTLLVILSGRGGATEQVARAASCAIAMRDALSGARVALATGGVQTSGRGLAGPVIDRAASLLASSAAAGVRIDEVTAGLLDTRFEVRSEAGAFVLAGRRDELEAPRTLLGKPTPCVGREKELALLEATFGECVAEPVARAVLVTAPAGFGKSRVRHELVDRIRKQGDVSVLGARGDPVGAGSAFVLVRQLVQHAARLHEGQSHAQARAALTRYLGAHFEGDGLLRVADFLGELVGVPNDTDVTSPQLRAARNDAGIMSDWLRRGFEEWLGAVCARQPVLIVLEDLHWGDLPSVGYLGDALRTFAGRPLMIVALARPEVHHLFPGLWSGAALQEIRLSGLTRRAAERLVRVALGDGALPEAVARLVERADGNAFYLEELIRQVSERGDDALPETVLAIAQSRLSGLEPEARHVLRAASVFGEVFWSGAVSALVGASRASDAGAWLDALVAREVLVRRTGDKFLSEKEYAFRHGLLREAAYAMLTDEDRATGHRLAGQWLESAGEKDPVVLAEHHEKGGARDRAIVHLVRAAQSAFEAGNVGAAGYLAERGLACGATGRALGLLRSVQMSVHYLRGEWAACLDRGREAIEVLDGGSVEWFEVASAVTYAAAGAGDPFAAAGVAQEILTLPFEPEPTGPYAMAAVNLFGGLVALGQLAAATGLLERIERVAPSPTGDPAFFGWQQYLVAGRDLAIRLHFGDATRAARRAMVTMDAAGSLVGRGQARLIGALVETELGRIDEAVRLAQEGIEMVTQVGATLIRGWGIIYLACALGRGGRLEEALTEATKCIGTLDDLSARATLADLHLAMGDMARAEGFARRVLQDNEGVLTAPWLECQAAVTLANVELARGHARDALALVDRAAARADRLVAPVLPLRVMIARAEASRMLGDVDGARRSIQQACARVERIAATIDDPSLRVSYLENVTENVRARALRRELGEP